MTQYINYPDIKSMKNTCITIDKELYLFYKDFFDGIKSFNRDFDEWIKYGT